MHMQINRGKTINEERNSFFGGVSSLPSERSQNLILTGGISINIKKSGVIEETQPLRLMIRNTNWEKAYQSGQFILAVSVPECSVS